MKNITLEQLLEAGCHFGHQVTRQNPRAREFIYQERDGIHVIDLAKTREGLLEAYEYVKKLAQKGGTIVFVGTKRQAQAILEQEAKRANVYFVSFRWVGGTLTNFEQMQKNFRKLKDLRALLQDDQEKAKYKKKEIGLMEKDRLKLEKLYASIVEMSKLPDAVFIVDTHKEDLAVREARQLNIPIVGIVDTNADPTIIDHPIPANDDAVGSLQLIISSIADAWLEGKKNQAESVKGEGEKQEQNSKNKDQKQEEKVEKEKKEAKKDEKTVNPQPETSDGEKKKRVTKKKTSL